MAQMVACEYPRVASIQQPLMAYGMMSVLQCKPSRPRCLGTSPCQLDLILHGVVERHSQGPDPWAQLEPARCALHVCFDEMMAAAAACLLICQGCTYLPRGALNCFFKLFSTAHSLWTYLVTYSCLQSCMFVLQDAEKWPVFTCTLLSFNAKKAPTLYKKPANASESLWWPHVRSQGLILLHVYPAD